MQRSFHLSKQKQCLLMSLVMFGLFFMGGCEPRGTETADDLELQNRRAKQGEKITSSLEIAEVAAKALEKEAQASQAWVSLFDGESLAGWDSIEFGGEGHIEVKEGAISVGAGDPLTGFYSTRDDLPKTNYEVVLSARKLEGIDFFCGLTFPVSESHCTLIVGGWAGSTIGLSCIDDQDASSNETSRIWPKPFAMKQWYKIRIRVEPDNITAWLDDEKIIDLVTTGKEIGLRGDTTLCTPMGVCSFMTHAEIKDFKFRNLEPEPESNKKDPTPGVSNETDAEK